MAHPTLSLILPTWTIQEKNWELYCQLVGLNQLTQCKHTHTHIRTHTADRMPRGQLTAHRWAWPVTPKLRFGIQRFLQAVSSRRLLLHLLTHPTTNINILHHVSLRWDIKDPLELEKWAFLFLKFAINEVQQNGVFFRFQQYVLSI